MSKKSTYEELEQRVKELEKDADRLKQAEETLKEERDKFQQYLAIEGFIIVVLDSNQEVIFINKKGCETLGRKEEEVIGKNWYDNFVPEKIRDGVRRSFVELMKGEIEGAEYIENPILTRKGEQRVIFKIGFSIY